MPKSESQRPLASTTDDADKVKGLRCLMSTPAIKDGYIYGLDRDGELLCCKLDTGEQLWMSLEHQGGKKKQFGSAFITPHKNNFSSSPTRAT